MTDQPPPGEPHLPPPPSPGSSGGHEPPPRGHEPAPPHEAQGASFPADAGTAPGASYLPPPPPPRGGSYPAPPSPSGGYAPPPPGPAIRALPTEAYTPWLTRVLAFIIDIIPYAVVVGIGTVIMIATQQSSCVTDISQYDVNQFCTDQPSMIGQLAQWLAHLIGLGYLLWNYGYRQGTTGSSLGKSVMKVKVVSEVTGQPLGFGLSIVRQLAHFVDAIICYIGFLFPLWDAKRQTLADKIMTTVVLPIEQ
jgi:uncharacterized RDD family membrane protein YckC